MMTFGGATRWIWQKVRVRSEHHSDMTANVINTSSPLSRKIAINSCAIRQLSVAKYQSGGAIKSPRSRYCLLKFKKLVFRELDYRDIECWILIGRKSRIRCSYCDSLLHCSADFHWFHKSLIDDQIVKDTIKECNLRCIFYFLSFVLLYILSFVSCMAFY